MKRRHRNLKYKSTDVINIEKAREARREKRRAEKAGKRTGRETEKTSAPSPRRTAQRMRRGALYGVILLVLAIMAGITTIHLISLKKAETEAAARLEQLEQEKAALEQELERVEDPSYVEEKAREDLRMIKDGETLYIVEESKEQTGSGGKEAEPADEKETE